MNTPFNNAFRVCFYNSKHPKTISKKTHHTSNDFKRTFGHIIVICNLYQSDAQIVAHFNQLALFWLLTPRS